VEPPVSRFYIVTWQDLATKRMFQSFTNAHPASEVIDGRRKYGFDLKIVIFCSEISEDLYNEAMEAQSERNPQGREEGHRSD
jgi:hypothetical protein